MSDGLAGFDLCAFPGAAPPAGTVSNFINPPSLAPTIIGVCVVMVTSATLFMVGRLFANYKRNLAWSDYCALIALIFSLAHGGLMLAQLKYARHQWDIPACWFFGNYAKIIFSQSMMLIPGLFFSKAAIFLLFQQIFEIENFMRPAIIIGMVFNLLIHLTGFGVEAYYQAPSPGQGWDDLMLSGKPNRAIYWGVVQSACSIVLDLYIFILPLPTIFRLNLPPLKRFQVVAVFSAAFMGVVANVVSLVYRVMLTIDLSDGTWKLYAILLCTVVEINIALIVCSVPGFSRFMRIYVSEWAPVKTLRSKIYGYSTSDKTKSPDSSHDSKNKPRTALGRREYIELNDAWLMKSGGGTATVDIIANGQGGQSPEIGGGSVARGGIVRTLDVEQQATSSHTPFSSENLVTTIPGVSRTRL
ncbi:hypothetical protein QBC46DRAFT_354284 [Diplogelasinospora grovesii]|uniref:Rhodopsin domain-containing protein n=1 Tax=Diplogelasinospora grovesii TaxID=303347 RepID=A0AAN6S578_9PEZI|nr:hypothetical protein QBC46DRAFT_354284 [Diplogelasinospora grovesii]